MQWSLRGSKGCLLFRFFNGVQFLELIYFNSLGDSHDSLKFWVVVVVVNGVDLELALKFRNNFIIYMSSSPKFKVIIDHEIQQLLENQSHYQLCQNKKRLNCIPLHCLWVIQMFWVD